MPSFLYRQKNPLLQLHRVSQLKLYIVCLHVCVMYVYLHTRAVIRKYAVHVRSCMITGLVYVLFVHCTLYRTHLGALFWLCSKGAAKHTYIFSSKSQMAPEGAVRLQLFVYVDLTCNYVCVRLHHVEKTYLAVLTSQSSKGACCPFWLLLCTVAMPSRWLWERNHTDLI